MEVLNSRAALLSNYEVLTLLRELESEHLLRTKTALRVKKEEEAASPNALASTGTMKGGGNPHLEASENLRTIQVEAISYLAADYLPTSSQTEEGITKLVKNLAPYELTKAEKLQIVNLAPSLPVELYVIIEELEDRFGEKIDEMLSHVEAAIPPSVNNVPSPMETNEHHQARPLAASAITIQEGVWDDADAMYDEELFDDGGAGAGIEGDLEMDED